MNEALKGSEAPGDFPAMADAIRRVLIASSRDKSASTDCARLAHRFGFDGFSYLVVRPGTVGTELLRHWTTTGPRWKAQYRKHAFQLVDPRVTLTVGRSIPLPWQQDDEATDPRLRAFHAAATASGICSGVAMSLQQTHGERAIVAWESSVSRRGASRDDIARCELATLALLACFVHERISEGRQPPEPTALAATLTQRERECLAQAARGMTSADISTKLGIAERTVNFHIGNIVRKLGALNRGEAIARGVALNLIGPRG